jgi:hypothetical protein
MIGTVVMPIDVLVKFGHLTDHCPDYSELDGARVTDLLVLRGATMISATFSPCSWNHLVSKMPRNIGQGHHRKGGADPSGLAPSLTPASNDHWGG